MKNNHRRLTALLMALIMIFTLSGCTVVDIDFMRYGWDGIVNGVMIWFNPERQGHQDDNDAEAADNSTADDAEKADDEDADADDADSSDDKGSKKGDSKKGDSKKGDSKKSGGSATGNGGSQNSNSGSQSGSNGGSSSQGSNSGSQGGSSGSQGGNSDSQGGNSSSGDNSGSQGGSSSSGDNSGSQGSTEKTYTTEEAVNLYKNAANPVKSTSGYTVTRTREKYIELGGNLSGISASIVKKAFSAKDDTTQKTYSSQSDIQKSFVVEKQSYVCALTASDVKSATVTPSGNNLIVKIYVKDDDGKNQNYSNKAVSATAVSDLAVPLSMGKLDYMACKDVWLEATINASGQLINLHTYMPAYFYGGSEYFAVALEQWWTISK